MLAVGLNVQMPVLVYRIGHLTLAQFLIVIAIGLYLRERRRGTANVVRWSILILTAL